MVTIYRLAIAIDHDAADHRSRHVRRRQLPVIAATGNAIRHGPISARCLWRCSYSY